MDFELKGEYIELFKLIKALNLANSGGMAKNMIAGEMVTVNGQVETRKRAKIRPGDVIELMGQRVKVKP